MRERPDLDSCDSSLTTPEPKSLSRIAIFRGVAFFALWLVLIQSVKLTDLSIGVCATLCATWVSLRLLPPTAGHLRFDILLTLIPHFLWEFVRAGIDIARRVLVPRPNLSPGFVTCPLGFPPGQTRNTFATITSLLPGTLACGEVDGMLIYHCLDVTQPVLEQLREEERRFARALVAGESHG